jgi:hypothetical protein
MSKSPPFNKAINWTELTTGQQRRRAREQVDTLLDSKNRNGFGRVSDKGGKYSYVRVRSYILTGGKSVSIPIDPYRDPVQFLGVVDHMRQNAGELPPELQRARRTTVSIKAESESIEKADPRWTYRKYSFGWLWSETQRSEQFQSLAPATQELYRNSLKQLLNRRPDILDADIRPNLPERDYRLSENDWIEIGRDLSGPFIGETGLQFPAVGQNTRDHMAKVIRQMFQMPEVKKYMGFDPSIHVRPSTKLASRRNKQENEPWSDEDFEAFVNFLGTARNDPESTPFARLQARMLRVGSLMARFLLMRRQDVLAARWSWFDEDLQTCNFTAQKNRQCQRSVLKNGEGRYVGGLRSITF